MANGRQSLGQPNRFHRALFNRQASSTHWSPVSTSLRENNTRRTRTAGNMLTTLFNPNPDDVFTGPITISPIVGDVTANSQAVYLFDTAKLGNEVGIERRTSLGSL